MSEYYKLTLEKHVTKSGMPSIKRDEIYLEINRERSAILAYVSLEKKSASAKIEKISEDEAIEALHRNEFNFFNKDRN
jgi:hypothetical protein